MIPAHRSRPAFVKMLNSGGRGMRSFVRLEPSDLLAAACRRTGLDDFGDASFRDVVIQPDGKTCSRQSTS